jgi:hypothetical protein
VGEFGEFLELWVGGGFGEMLEGLGGVFEGVEEVEFIVEEVGFGGVCGLVGDFIVVGL